jgi:hypothetical protein
MRESAISAAGFAGAAVSGWIASASRIQCGQPSKSNPGLAGNMALLAAADDSGSLIMAICSDMKKPAADFSARV